MCIYVSFLYITYSFGSSGTPELPLWKQPRSKRHRERADRSPAGGAELAGQQGGALLTGSLADVLLYYYVHLYAIYYSLITEHNAAKQHTISNHVMLIEAAAKLGPPPRHVTRCKAVT